MIYIELTNIIYSADYKCVISFENICTQPELSPFPPSLPNSTLANLRDLRVWQQTPGLDSVSTLPSGILSMFNYEREREFSVMNIVVLKSKHFFKVEMLELSNKNKCRLHYLC